MATFREIIAAASREELDQIISAVTEREHALHMSAMEEQEDEETVECIEDEEGKCAGCKTEGMVYRTTSFLDQNETALYCNTCLDKHEIES